MVQPGHTSPKASQNLSLDAICNIPTRFSLQDSPKVLKLPLILSGGHTAVATNTITGYKLCSNYLVYTQSKVCPNIQFIATNKFRLLLDRD